MSDNQIWSLSFTVICLAGYLTVHSIARYAIMRSTEKYISVQSGRERDQ